ncbi:phage/plasmid primase, P4 family [Paenibacillus sp. sgz5001063]|uniref:DNA primase family protein n=1 Tax=Paenibacillus sp. sgz5001063 TaxID=3242474 RepID=UPI0036D39D20
MNQTSQITLEDCTVPLGINPLEGDEVSRLEERGFHYDANGKIRFNANVFTAYFLSRVKLVRNKGAYYIFRRIGKYQEASENDLLRITRQIIHEAKGNIYQTNFSREYMQVLKLETPQVDSLDSFKHLINVKNGMLNMLTGELIPHSPEYYSTVQLDLEYAPEEEAELFNQFIAEIMLHDEDLIALLQEVVGYILSSETRIQKAFFFVGGGSNGKGVLTKIITQLAGQRNVSNLTLNDFGDRFRIADLVGKAVNIASENEVGQRGLQSEKFKQLVAGDDVIVERKFEMPYSFTPICKFLFSVNALPRNTDHSHGLYRRLQLIPFDLEIPDDKQDLGLIEKLEAELPGILNWALDGLERLRENNFIFTDSERSRALLRRYKQEQNPLQVFITEFIDSGSNKEGLFRSEIRKTLKAWCLDNGEEELLRMSAQMFWPLFKTVLAELGLPHEEKQFNGNYRFKGLKWK